MLGSLRADVLAGRSISGDVTDVKTTLSSWDNCMAKAYCKSVTLPSQKSSSLLTDGRWPVIAAIIVASLIAISFIWCIARCACCGRAFCCSCFSCFRCCGNCCGCCDDPRDRKHKHLDEYPPPGPFAPTQGYRAPQPMMTGGVAQAPQFASFEVGPNGRAIAPTATPVHEDALPPMPSWDTAIRTRVAADDPVEMGDLNPTTGQRIPLMSSAAPAPRVPSPSVSPANRPYNELRGQDSYMATTPPPPAATTAIGANRRPSPPGPYRSASSALDAPPARQGSPYDPYAPNFPSELGAVTAAMGANRRPSPSDPYRNASSELDTPPARQGSPYDPYATNSPSELGAAPASWDNQSPYLQPQNNAIELESPMESTFPPSHATGAPNAYNAYNDGRQNPATSQPYNQGYGTSNVYGTNQPSRQFSNGQDTYYNPPQRQPSDGTSRPLMRNGGQPAGNPNSTPYPSSGPARIASPQPYSNNGGFNYNGASPMSRSPPPNQFTSPQQGYRQAIPQYQQDPYHSENELTSPGGYANSTGPPSYASRPPAQQQQHGASGGAGATYPGYESYAPRGNQQNGY